MAWTLITPAQFKTAKPQFASVPDATVQAYLDMAGVVILADDMSWLTQARYSAAIMAFTCHLMTLEGLAADGDSGSMSQYQTIRSGELTLTRFARAASGSTYVDWLNSTPCGQFYAMLIKGIKGGPRVVHAGGPCLTGYAKDWPGPAYGWPGVFGGC